MRLGHSAVPENLENLHKQGDFELGFERWADIFPEKEELFQLAPPHHSHSSQDTESQFDQTSHSQLGGKYLVWVGGLGRRQDVLGRFSERISEFPWSQELPGREESVLSWKRRILGVNGVWDCFYMKICSCLAQPQWTATSKHFLLFLAGFLGTCLQLWKDEDNFSPVIDVSSFLFVSLPQRPESFCACPISGAEKCVLKRSSRRLGKGTPFAVIWLQTSNIRKLKGHIWVEGLVLKLFTDFRN